MQRRAIVFLISLFTLVIIINFKVTSSTNFQFKDAPGRGQSTAPINKAVYERGLEKTSKTSRQKVRDVQSHREDFVLSVKLLNDNPEALYNTLGSNIFSGKDLLKIDRILARATEKKMIIRLIEALGGSPDPKGQEILMAAIEHCTLNKEMSKFALAKIHPKALNDSSAKALMKLVDSEQSLEYREIAASTLAMFILSRGAKKEQIAYLNKKVHRSHLIERKIKKFQSLSLGHYHRH